MRELPPIKGVKENDLIPYAISIIILAAILIFIGAIVIFN